MQRISGWLRISDDSLLLLGGLLMVCWAALFFWLKIVLESLWETKKMPSRNGRRLAAATVCGLGGSTALLMNWASPFLMPETWFDPGFLFFWGAFWGSIAGFFPGNGIAKRKTSFGFTGLCAFFGFLFGTALGEIFGLGMGQNADMGLFFALLGGPIGLVLAIPAGWKLTIFGKRLPQHFDDFVERLRQTPQPWIRKRVLACLLALAVTEIVTIQWAYSVTVKELAQGEIWTGILFQPIDSARDLRQVGRMKQLRRVLVRGSATLAPSALAPLGTLPQLERVELRDCLSALPGLACLAHSPALREVVVEDWSGKKADLGFAEDLTQLEVLNIRQLSGLTDSDLHSLRNLTRLRELRLPDCRKITDEGLKSLSGLTQLQSFQCWHLSQITDEGLSAMKDWKELERLDLAKCRGISGRGFEFLQDLTALRHLTVPEEIRDEGLAFLKFVPQVTSLMLSECANVTDAGLEEVIRVMPQLEELTLIECRPLTESWLKSVAKLPKLRRLDLWLFPKDSESSENLLAALADSPLEELYLRGNENLRGLRNLRNLRAIGLNVSRLTEEELQELQACPKLEVVQIRAYFPLSSSKKRMIRKALPKCRVETVQSGND